MYLESCKCDPTEVAGGTWVSITLAGLIHTGLGVRLDSCIEAQM